MAAAICHICGKALQTSAKSFGERIAAEIRPRAGKTRYYCIKCWEQELRIAGGVRDGKKEKQAI